MDVIGCMMRANNGVEFRFSDGCGLVFTPIMRQRAARVADLGKVEFYDGGVAVLTFFARTPRTDARLVVHGTHSSALRVDTYWRAAWTWLEHEYYDRSEQDASHHIPVQLRFATEVMEKAHDHRAILMSLLVAEQPASAA